MKEIDHGESHSNSHRKISLVRTHILCLVYRRLYLFQRPLRPLSGLRSSSESAPVSTGLTASPINWNDLEDPSETNALPRISDRPLFDIVSHVGVIILEEHTCTNRDLSLQAKLSSGLIYEHPGPDMERSQDGGGMRTHAEAVRKFTALEFIGNTTMGNDQLDTICKISTVFSDSHY